MFLFRSCEYFPSAELDLAAQKIGVDVKHIDSLSNNTARFAQYICYLQLPYTQKHTYTVIRFF